MGSKAISIFSLSAVMMLILIPFASGKTIDESQDVDIDSYITLEMIFDSGESLEIDATITASPDPITVFLIKGEDEFEKWKSTEDIDINAIMNGEDVPATNSTFVVINSFSETNTTFFESSISIGEKDSYYLVIVIHRDVNMTKEEILSLASRVDYIVTYEEKEKDVPYYLIPIAILVFIIGIALIVFYLRSVRKESQVEEEEPSIRCRRPPPRGRAPPFR